jgi:uncharacterized protein
VKTIGIAIALILIIYFGVSAYVVSMSKVPRLPLAESPAAPGLTYEDVSFPSRIDGVTLSGWYLPGEKDFIIVMVSGGIQNRIDTRTGTLEIGRDLEQRGFSILMFDLRGRGESEGQGRLLAYDERDIGGAVDYAMSRGYPAGSVGLLGFSAGAKSSLIFASKNEVGAVVADSSFVHVTDDLVRKASSETGIPQPLVRLFVPGTLLIAKVMYGYDAVNLGDIVADIISPLLLIYGEKDDLVTMAGVRELFEASVNPSDELWIVPGAGHSLAYRTNPVDYIDRVAAFFDKAAAV